MKLLLFDIDGTLLMTRGTGRRAVEEALSALCERPVTTSGVVFAGRTDPLIIRDALVNSGLSAPEAAALLPRALEVYTRTACRILHPSMINVLPGVAALLSTLNTRGDVRLGLVTGNLESTAYLKLRAAGLAEYFPFGAFGSDEPDRLALPRIALARAAAHLGRSFSGRDVVVIGDTAADIACGRHIGGRTVAVCTGYATRADLARHAPDVLFDDFSDVERFLREVVGAAPSDEHP